MKKLLETGVKKLNKEELELLCLKIREFLVESVSKTGGHLSPNLGVVELTIALHKVFDSKSDRLIFDVGHQSYVHKILTNRADEFKTLRQKNGLSGFAKPSESDHDAFISGHASVSISAALGMARARTLAKENKSIVAIIGDGALTGGLAFEALNNAGASGEPLIVVLNDNVMSIGENVGAIPTHLSRLRITKKYQDAKKKIHKLAKKTKKPEEIEGFIRNIKESIKITLLKPSFFEQMGFVYVPNIDGHNIDELCEIFEKAKKLQKPVLLHVTTKKGKGYEYSEKKPDIFHGTPPFDIKTGEVIKKTEHSFSKNFGDELCEIAEKNKKVCAITAAMKSGTGLTSFAEKYEERFFDVGIAESHAVTMSAGMSCMGYIPVCTLYSTFLQRAYDQVIHDVALENTHVVFAIDRAGIVGDDGETHNGVFDVPMMLSIPNVKILAPSNYMEQKEMLNQAIYETNCPVVLRYPKGEEGLFTDNTAKNKYHVYGTGDITIITYGMQINAVYPLLETENIRIIKINELSLDLKLIDIELTQKIIVLEDCVNTGSLASKLALHLLSCNKNIKYFKALNTGDMFTKQARVKEVYEEKELDINGVKKYVKEADFE